MILPLSSRHCVLVRRDYHARRVQRRLKIILCFPAKLNSIKLRNIYVCILYMCVYFFSKFSILLSQTKQRVLARKFSKKKKINPVLSIRFSVYSEGKNNKFTVASINTDIRQSRIYVRARTKRCLIIIRRYYPVAFHVPTITFLYRRDFNAGSSYARALIRCLKF